MPTSKAFGSFWTALSQLVEDYKTVHIRRHGVSFFMPDFAMSIASIIEATVEILKLEDQDKVFQGWGIKIPAETGSAYLQFTPTYFRYVRSMVFVGMPTCRRMMIACAERKRAIFSCDN